MMLRRLGCTALVGGASILSFPRNAHPQVNATVDLGASAVRYDGFLPSSAAALTPTFTWDGARGGLTIRGTYLRFESGNRSLQGSVGASVLTQPVGSWRGELSASAGASSYAGFPSFWHALGDVRLHHDSDRRGLVIDATAGRSSFGKTQSARPVAAVSIATWLRRDQVAVLASVHRAFVGDTQYSDINLTVRVQRATLSLETSVGARLWSRGARRGVHGGGSGTLALRIRVAFVLSACRYQTYPIRPSIAGPYPAASRVVRVPSGHRAAKAAAPVDRRSASIPDKRKAAPRARTIVLHRRPIAVGTAGNRYMVAQVSRKPMVGCSVRALLTYSAGASSLTA